MYLSPESLLIVALLIVAILFLGRFLVWILALAVVGLVALLLVAVYSDLTTGTHAVEGLLNLLYPAITALAVVIATFFRGLGQKPKPAPESKYKH